MRTSFHHQPEAQHPKSPAIETPAGRLPHLSANSDQSLRRSEMTRCAISDIALHGDNGRYGSPGLNGRSFPGGTLSSAIARTIATVM
jgi:hypothetical protein